MRHKKERIAQMKNYAIYHEWVLPQSHLLLSLGDQSPALELPLRSLGRTRVPALDLKGWLRP